MEGGGGEEAEEVVEVEGSEDEEGARVGAVEVVDEVVVTEMYEWLQRSSMQCIHTCVICTVPAV